MRFVIVTGMSGAGRSSVLKMLEDEGYFCVDNLPVPFLIKFAEMSWHKENNMSRVAIGIDIRNKRNLKDLEGIFEELKKAGYGYEILFMDSRTETLIKRYKETRRLHPLGDGGRIENAIMLEREQLQFLKDRADYIIDTSNMLIRDLKAEIYKIFVEDRGYSNFYITLLSFGFKYGIPSDADLVMDVRFLPNPYYVENLKPKTGNDQEVYDYVMDSPDAETFLEKYYDLLTFLIPRYVAEGKTQLVVAIGCTGGKHRSVTMTNALYKRMSALEYGIKKEHRDIDKDTKRSSVQSR